MFKELPELLAELEEVYKDIHAHPELSMNEHRTADIAWKHLKSLEYEVVQGLGGTGTVGVLRNGEGSTVMLRADMDALPLKESTGLDYASTATTKDGTPITHACGHDMHVTWLMGVTRVFAKH